MSNRFLSGYLTHGRVVMVLVMAIALMGAGIAFTSTPAAAVPLETDLTLAPHANQTANATSPAGAVVAYTSFLITDADVVPDVVPPTVTCTPTSGSTFAIGTTTVTCTATDADDAPSSVTFTVTVADTDLAIAPHTNITVGLTSAAGAVVNYIKPAAIDEDVPVTATVACLPISGSTFPIGTTAVNCTATDADDTPSTATSTFTVTVLDNDLALAPQANITQNATSPLGAVVNYSKPGTTDEAGAVETAAVVNCTPVSGSVFKIGVTTVTCTATSADDSNTAQSSFTVTVVGAAGQISALLHALTVATPPVDLGSSLVAQLEGAQDSLAAGNTIAACGQPTAFINEVEAQAGKEITLLQASTWEAAAEQIMDVIPCPRG